MIQYNDAKETVIDKEGNSVKVSVFRDRILYPRNVLAEYRVDGGNSTRPDIIAIGNYSKFSGVGPLIDSNEKDVFSFRVGDKYYLPIGGVGIV